MMINTVRLLFSIVAIHLSTRHILTASASVHQLQDCVANSSSLLQKVVQGKSASVASRRASCSIDVMLLIDVSNSVGGDYGTLKTAAANFVTKLQKKNEATNGDSRIGLVSFAKRVELHSKLTHSFSHVVSKIRQLPKLHSWTHLWEALDMAALELVGSSKSKGEKIAVVITDGEPTGHGEGKHGGPKTALAAANLKNYARLAIVGIEHGSTAYMESLASKPVKDNYYALGTFAGLTDSFVDTLIEGVCRTPPPTPVSTPTTPAPTPRMTPPPPRPTPGNTPAPPASPAPIPEVKPTPTPTPRMPTPNGRTKDTGASCRMMNTCFQRTRGETYCDDETKTCQCTNFPNEYVVERDVPLTKEWKVCRKSEDDFRGEDNSVEWMFLLVQDIASSYASSLR